MHSCHCVHQISGESQWERPLAGDSVVHIPSIYDSNVSHYSATAGDYTIEL